MPYNFGYFDTNIDAFARALAPTGKILDVGAGAGKFGWILKKSFPDGIDGLEIFNPYIDQFNLLTAYKNIYHGDIRLFPVGVGEYDLILMGDIVEHLSVRAAQITLARLVDTGAHVLVMVPYLYPQGECHDNEHEAHLQPDITREVFLDRYPGALLLLDNDQQGVFLFRGKDR